MLPIPSAYVKHYYGQTKWMYFLVEDDGLLKKYNTISDTVSADIKKCFDSELAYKKKSLTLSAPGDFCLTIPPPRHTHSVPLPPSPA